MNHIKITLSWTIPIPRKFKKELENWINVISYEQDDQALTSIVITYDDGQFDDWIELIRVQMLDIRQLKSILMEPIL